MGQDEEQKKECLRIGRIIAEKRQERGLSLRKLSELCGVPFQNITRLEHGQYNPSIEILSKITDALGLKIELVDNAKIDKENV